MIGSTELIRSKGEKEEFWMKQIFRCLYSHGQDKSLRCRCKRMLMNNYFICISQISIIQVNYTVKNYAAFKNIHWCFHFIDVFMLFIQKHLIHLNILYMWVKSYCNLLQFIIRQCIYILSVLNNVLDSYRVKQLLQFWFHILTLHLLQVKWLH